MKRHLITMILLFACICVGQDPEQLYLWAEWAAFHDYQQTPLLYQQVIEQPDAPALLKARAARRLVQRALDKDDPEAARRWSQLCRELARGQPLPDDGPLPSWYSPRSMQSFTSTKRDDEEVRWKLQNIIIPRLEFEGAPIQEVVQHLREQSRDLDIEGEGINIILLLVDRPENDVAAEDANGGFAWGGEDFTFAEDELADSDAVESLEPAMDFSGSKPIVTMDFDNIPLGEAIRYLCSGFGLKYRIEPYGIIMADPGLPLQPCELKVYPVDPGFVSPSGPKFETGDDDEDDEPVISASLQDFFEPLGVEFPTGSFVVQGATREQLVVWNTPANQLRIREILTELTPAPTQVQLDLRVIETAATPGDVPGLGELLSQEHRWLAKQSFVGVSGTTFHREQADGMRFTAEPRIESDGYTIRFNLDWSWQTPEGQTLRFQGAIMLWDGEGLVIPLEQIGDRERFLLITSFLINPAGLPVRPHNWPQQFPELQGRQ